MLSYEILICNGCIETARKQQSPLTWFEEWLYFFEKLYSRGSVRCCDFAEQYQASEYQLRRIFNTKLKILLEF
jgi:hypothetical protein